MNEVTITHRADLSVSYKPNLNRLGAATSLEEELPNMDTQEALKAHLMATDEEYRRLAAEHSGYAKKLEELESLPHLSVEEEIEEHRDRVWRREGTQQVETAFDAERFIEQVGFTACLTDCRKPGPSLYVAVCVAVVGAVGPFVGTASFIHEERRKKRGIVNS